MKKIKELFNKTIKNRSVSLSILVIVHIILILLFINSFSPSYSYINNKYGSPDADNYVTMAKQLIDKGVYGYSSTESNAYVTPSQPLLVSGILIISKLFNFDDLMFLQFFNLLFSIGNIILIYLISNKLFKNRNIAFLAGLLYSLYFPNVYYIRAILTEIPTIFFMLLSILTFIKSYQNDRKIYHILFSIFYAITIMFRPALAPLLIVPIYLNLKKYGFIPGVKKLMLYLVGFVLVIMPWIIRNYVMFDNFFIFSSHGGNPMLAGTYPYYLEEFNFGEMERLGMGYNEYAKYRVIQGFKSDPKLYLSWFTVGKFMWLFCGPSKWIYYSDYYNNFTLFAYGLHFLIFFTALYAIYKYKQNKAIFNIGLLVIIYIIIHLFFIAIDRFGYLMFPLFSILSGYSIVMILTNIKKRCNIKKQTK